MSMEDIVKEIAAALEKEGNSKTVFGEPVKLETKTVIPVATVKLGAGGAAMSPNAQASEIVKAIFGGGGGGAFDVHPVGFISEKNGEVAFTPIHLDVRGKPFLNEASAGIGRVIDTVTSIVTHRFATNGHPRN